MHRLLIAALFCGVMACPSAALRKASAQQAYGRAWAGSMNARDWERFYHYPFVYYPQNYWGSEYYRSSENLYYRYPPEMRIPVYNTGWYNYYPEARFYQNGRDFHPGTGLKYHRGHHFNLDVF